MSYQYPTYSPYPYSTRTDMAPMNMSKMEEMKNMMMEHMRLTQAIKNQLDDIDQRLRKMEHMMM